MSLKNAYEWIHFIYQVVHLPQKLVTTCESSRDISDTFSLQLLAITWTTQGIDVQAQYYR